MAGAGLIIWLALSANPRQQLRHEIEEALDRGAIGGLTEPQHSHFAQVLEWWAQAAGIEDRILLDRPFKANALNVFSIESPIAGLAEVEPGNAIYDPYADAIFVSKELFDPSSVVHLYGNISIQRHEDQPPRTSGYLLFVFLHELGHRLLHQHPTKGLTVDQLEDQADNFAIEVILRAYEGRVPEAARPSYSAPYSGPRAPVDSNIRPQRVFPDLAGSLRATTDILLHTETTFSPYFQDDAHATFVERAEGMVSALLNVAEGASDRGYVGLAQDHLARIRETLERPLVEIHSPDPITAAGLLDDRLVMFAAPVGGESPGREYGLSLAAIETLLCHALPGTSQLGPRPTPGPLAKGSFSTWFASVVSADGVGSPYITTQEGWHQRSGNSWTKRDTPEGAWTRHDGHLLVLAADEPILPKLWNLYEDHQYRGAITHDELSSYLQSQQGLPRSVRADLSTLFGDQALFLANAPDVKGDRHIFGYFTVDLGSLQPINFTPLNLAFPEVGVRRLLDQEISFLKVSGAIAPYAVLLAQRAIGVGEPGAPDTVEVWRLSSSLPPERVAAHVMMASKIPGARDIGNFMWVSVPFVSANSGAPDTGLLIDVYLDSIYHFDPSAGSIETLFHPGGLRRSINADGLVAVYAEGASKLYITAPRNSEIIRGCAQNG